MSIPPTDDAPLGPDELIDLVGRQVLEAQERADTAAALVRDLGAVRGRESSPGDEVTVTVDSSGRLVDISFDDAATRLTGGELSRLVLATTVRAQRRAAREAVALSEAAFGEGSGVSAQLRTEYERALGRLDEEEGDGRDR